MHKYLTGAILLYCCFVLNIPAANAKHKFVGTEGCNCHKVQITDWYLSEHGRAFETLKPGKKRRKKLKAKLDPEKDYRKERKCQKCHTTGYKKPGGFVDVESSDDMTGVGCESCHGPGSEYRVLHDLKAKTFTRDDAKAAGAIYGSEDPAVCTACHNEKSGHFDKSAGKKYQFDWKEALKDHESYHRRIGINKPGNF